MRALALDVVAVAIAFWLTGCGYVGDPLPPALNIPKQLSDVAAVQRGANLVITFTTPALTTEDLVLTGLGGIDVRVSDKQVSADTPKPGEPATVRVPMAEWQGRDASIVVRLAGPKGRYSSPSQPVVVSIGAPLSTPDKVVAAAHPDGVRLTWKAVPGEQYRILRDDVQVGTSAKGEYIDDSAAFGKEFRYFVQAFVDKRESEPSEVLAITPRDQFAPAAPRGLNVVAGLKSIELLWERNGEPDLGTYRVYRATGAGEFTVLVDGLEAVAFSDRQTEPGTIYRYRLTALDKSGNESEPSQVLEVRTLQTNQD